MLTFFPTPYPDELLYSVYARYHVRSGNTSPKLTMKELFSTSNTTAVIDLPSNLDALIKNMPMQARYKTEELIFNHTLYPFYNVFLPQDRAEKVINSMKGQNGGDIHTRLGVVASTIETPKYLKYCEQCNNEDKQQYGETYWHRLFQVPGVLICPKHKVLLKNSTLPYHSLNKHEYITADESCIPSSSEIQLNKGELEKLIHIAKEVQELLVQRFENHDMLWFFERYKQLLKEKGFATANGRVDQRELTESFTRYYGQEFLKLLYSEVDYDFQNNWLASIVRKHRKIFHPIRHLLLINFLLGSTKSFFEKEVAYTPFGKAPWPCLNKAAEHYLKKVINEVKVTHDADTKQPVGTFSCMCGFVYSRRGPDKSEQDRYRIGRIKCFGTEWEKRLMQLSSDTGLSLREISRRLNVDVNTVKKYIEKLGNLQDEKQVVAKNTLSKKKDIKEELKMKYREQWLQIRKENKELSKNQLRQLDNAAYMWLYKNDKAWLDENSPSKIIFYIENNRVNWQQRDNEIYCKVKNEVENILNSNEKPERITISRIGKRLGILATLEKNIDKLPNTHTYLKKVVENHEAFQIRRIRWAVSELIKEEKELKEWKILKLAGIRFDCSDEINAEIKKQIDARLHLIDKNI